MVENCVKALLEYNEIELGKKVDNPTIKLFLNRNKNLYNICLETLETEHCNICKELEENDLPYNCLSKPIYCTRKNFTLFQKFIYAYEEVLSLLIE